MQTTVGSHRYFRSTETLKGFDGEVARAINDLAQRVGESEKNIRMLASMVDVEQQGRSTSLRELARDIDQLRMMVEEDPEDRFTDLMDAYCRLQAMARDILDIVRPACTSSSHSDLLSICVKVRRRINEVGVSS